MNTLKTLMSTILEEAVLFGLYFDNVVDNKHLVIHLKDYHSFSIILDLSNYINNNGWDFFELSVLEKGKPKKDENNNSMVFSQLNQYQLINIISDFCYQKKLG